MGSRRVSGVKGWHRWLAKGIHRGVEAIGRGVAWLTFAMAGVTGLVVALRYGFDTSAIPLQESVLYLHALVVMPGLAYALANDAHVRVDVFASRMRPRTRRIIDLTGHVLLLAPTCVTVAIVSWPYVAQSWRILEGSPEVGGIPAVFVLKTLIPLGAVLLLLQAAAMAAQALSPQPKPPADGMSAVGGRGETVGSDLAKGVDRPA